MKETLALEIPPLAEFVGAARLFVGAAGRHFGVKEETVSDLKIAVSEACTGAIAAQAAQNGDGMGRPVRLTISPEDQSVVVEVVGEAGFWRTSPMEGATDPSILKNGLGLGLVEALFPEAQIHDLHDGSGRLRLTLKRSELDSMSEFSSDPLTGP